METQIERRQGYAMRTRTAWGAIAAGAIGGFATAMVLATVGIALGFTAGAGIDDADPDKVAGLGIAGAVWVILTAAVVGLVGGALLAWTSDEDRKFCAGSWGVITWAAGLTLAALVGTMGGMGLMSATAGVAANAAQIDSSREPVDQRVSEDLRAQEVAAAAAGSAWVLVVAQLTGLAATVVAARSLRPRFVRTYHQVAAATT